MIQGNYVRTDGPIAGSNTLKITNDKMIYGAEEPNFYEAKYKVSKINEDKVFVFLVEDEKQIEINVEETGLQIDIKLDDDGTDVMLHGFEGSWKKR